MCSHLLDFEKRMITLGHLRQLQGLGQFGLYMKEDNWTTEYFLHFVNDLQLDSMAPNSVADWILEVQRYSSALLLASALFASGGRVRRGSLPD